MDEKSLSPNTVHKHHACIRKALDYGLKQQFVHRNVSDAVELPRKDKFTGQSYTRDQLNTLLDGVRGTNLELPVHLAGYLGLRREEIVGLRWKYVDLEKECLDILVTSQKSAVSRDDELWIYAATPQLLEPLSIRNHNGLKMDRGSLPS
jgi:integrase